MVAAMRTPAAAPALPGPSFDEVQRSLPNPDSGEASVTALPGRTAAPTALDDLRQKLKPAPQERLARMVDLNEERTALILRKWAAPEAAG
jgi:flagellar M-ring protein FliF